MPTPSRKTDSLRPNSNPNSNPRLSRHGLTEAEAELEDTIELLHMWRNEAGTYRMLAEAIAKGRYTPAQALEAIGTGNPPTDGQHILYLSLSPEEHKAATATAAQAKLTPERFLWTCLDCIMAHSDDPDILTGCQHAAQRRFQHNLSNEWPELK